MSQTLSAERLWEIPRVGAPEPLPDGTGCIVPVTTYDREADRGTTRLWRVALDGSDPLPLTAPERSASAPRIAPDGRRLAFLRKPEKSDAAGAGDDPSSPDHRQVFVLPLDGGEATQVGSLPLGADGIRWLPDGRLLVRSKVIAGTASLAETAERAAEQAADPVSARVTERRVARFWDRWLTDDRVPHLFVLDPGHPDLAPVDIMPASSRWMPMMDETGGFDIHPDGTEVTFVGARIVAPDERLLWGLFAVPIPQAGEDPPADRAGTRITPDDHDRNFSRPRYSPDGRHLLFGMRREFDFYADRTRLAVRRLSDDRETVLTEAWDRSASGWSFDPSDPDRVWLVTDDGGRTALCRLDLAAATSSPDANPPRTIALGGTFGAPQVAGGRVFMTRNALDAPPEVFTLSVAADATPADGDAPVERITRFTDPALDGIAMGAVREIHFAGHGGDDVQAFVVWPPGIEAPDPLENVADGSADDDGVDGDDGGDDADRLPLVHMIHGGPHGNFGDQWHWRWNAQVFAAPGYMAALVNFHGSTGWGDAFTRSILGRWGDQPAVDIEAATDELVARGWADAERMAITGGSYGGYLVSWLAATSDRYSCAVNHAGVSDFQTQFASDLTQGRARSFGGELWDNLDGLDRWNPLRRAAGFGPPMLVLHGERDYRVPYAQALQIYAVYKARGLPARLVVYPDENHWILKPNNSVHWYGEVQGWLARWLSDDGDPDADRDTRSTEDEATGAATARDGTRS